MFYNTPAKPNRALKQTACWGGEFEISLETRTFRPAGSWHLITSCRHAHSAWTPRVWDKAVASHCHGCSGPDICATDIPFSVQNKKPFKMCA